MTIVVEHNPNSETTTLRAGRVHLTLETPGDAACLTGVSRDSLSIDDLRAISALLRHPVARSWLDEIQPSNA